MIYTFYLIIENILNPYLFLKLKYQKKHLFLTIAEKKLTVKPTLIKL